MWYVLQITVWSTVVYYYVTEISPKAHIGMIMLEATLITWLVTKAISVILDTVTYRLIRVPRTTPVKHKSLVRHRLPLRRSHQNSSYSRRVIVKRGVTRS